MKNVSQKRFGNKRLFMIYAIQIEFTSQEEAAVEWQHKHSSGLIPYTSVQQNFISILQKLMILIRR